MRFAVVDVGNTSTAVGLWSDGRVSRVSHCDGGFAEAFTHSVPFAAGLEAVTDWDAAVPFT